MMRVVSRRLCTYFCQILSHSIAAHDFILLQCDTGGARVDLEVMGGNHSGHETLQP